MSRVGVEGGFSTLQVGVEEDLERVGILAGSIADGQHRTGPELAKAIRAEYPWMGEAEFGGGGVIPLRRPYDRLVAPGIALLGDAACQVFPAHGSGVGVGLIAGRILADAVASSSDPGSLESTWAYQAGFQREVGRVLAFYDAMRRVSQALTSEEIDAMFAAGFLSTGTGAAGIEQRIPGFNARETLSALGGAVRFPALARRVLPWVVRAAAASLHYLRYPQEPDLAALRRWSRVAGRIFGETPDLS